MGASALLVACGGDGPTGTDGDGPGLAFVTQPSDATAGEALSPAVEVEVQDASGNRDTGSSANGQLGDGSTSPSSSPVRVVQ